MHHKRLFLGCLDEYKLKQLGSPIFAAAKACYKRDQGIFEIEEAQKMELQDKVVVITGGSGGIGQAMARAFKAHGAAGIVLADLDSAAVERAAVSYTHLTLPTSDLV